MKDLLDYNLTELEQQLLTAGFEKYRAKQVWQWLYKKAVTDFSAMKNLPQNLQNFLNTDYQILPLKVVTEQKSRDGTIKWLIALADGKQIETVFIPEEKRGTLCISSQVGCTLNCKFCHTGTQKWQKNLTVAEIIGQVLLAKILLGEFMTNKKIVTNVVFMGMGEPLLNYDNVKKSCTILIDNMAMDFSWRKITISTSGIIPNIAAMITDVKTGLAISFHAPNDKIRTEIMPINKKYPILELLKICKDYAEQTDQIVTLEYVMLAGINDQDEHVYELIRLVKDIPVKFNLIPFNPWPGTKYKCSSNNRIHKFSQILQQHNIEAPIRKTRGEDILAACGQLKSLFATN